MKINLIFHKNITLLLKGGPHFLVSSPYKDSILMTSAPKSDKYIVAYGPAKILDKSKTLIFFNI